MRKIVLLAVAWAATACAVNDKSTRPEATKDELGQMGRDFAATMNAKDAKKAASLYTEDAMLLPPNEPIVRGRAKIEEYWRGALEAGGLRDVAVETIVADSSGSLGYEMGRYSTTANRPKREVIKEKGKYIEILRRGPDGKWGSGTRRPNRADFLLALGMRALPISRSTHLSSSGITG